MRVYVAGPYSSGDIITILENIRNGQRQSVRLLLAGHEPFCPWLDYQFNFMLRDKEKLYVEDYYRYSMAWLEVSDAVVVLRGWDTSKGTLAEMKRAKELGIPIYYGIDQFLRSEVSNE